MPIFDFLNPNIPGGLPTVVMPIIEATDSGLIGYLGSTPLRRFGHP
jgi:hypothetical protein